MTKEIRTQIEKYVQGIHHYLVFLEASGQYKKRKNIALSDVELQRYFGVMQQEVLQLAMGSVLFDDFLEIEGKRDKSFREALNPSQTLLKRWRIYVTELKIRIHKGRVKLEEDNDEPKKQKNRPAGDPEKDATRKLAGKARTISGAPIRERRARRRPAS